MTHSESIDVSSNSHLAAVLESAGSSDLGSTGHDRSISSGGHGSSGSSGGHDSVNGTAHGDSCSAVIGHCEEGLLIPSWQPPPTIDMPAYERAGRAVVFVLVMIYIFLGVSIVADKFVTAIEVIVSQKRKVKVVSRTTGTETFVRIPIWNETVAHLTLFVLGNCAPEIILSAIEVINRDFQEGELGPGTIFGSGAYNLFVITGICCMSVPKGRTLRIHELRIFFVTAFWMIFAYVWIYIMLMVSSPGIVEVWESFLTLSFFPLCVVTAYLADKRLFGAFNRCRLGPSRQSISPVPLSNVNSETGDANVVHKERPTSAVDKAQELLEKREKRFLTLLAEMKKKHPNATMAHLREMVEIEILKEEPKSRNYYRMEASKRMAGGSIINKDKLRERIAAEDLKKKNTDPRLQLITFDPIEYRVMENVGTFHIHVFREGGNLNNSISVQYETKDGTGKAGVDYKRASGKIIFKKKEAMKSIPIQIIDDDEFNLDTQFYLVISKPQIVKTKGDGNIDLQLKIVGDGTATITKLDDDHGGVFGFESATVNVDESIGEAAVKIVRSTGAKGDVSLPFKITPFTAQPGVHFVMPSSKSIVFKNGAIENFIIFPVTDEGKLSVKSVTLEIELGEPQWLAEKQSNTRARRNAPSTSKLGKPRLGDIATITVAITENPELRMAVEGIAEADMSSLMGATSWADQFRQAVSLPNGDGDELQELEDEEEDDVEIVKKRSWKDYVSHILTIFWKILFAFIPPTGILQGWPAFFVCLGFIGVLVAIIGDLAVYLGCTIGLKDELTAITLVSLGTSLPDMFGSRIAAMREETADAAIGHITGACAVNVFLGIGLAWTLGSVKQSMFDGKPGLAVVTKKLTFSITLFFACGSVAIFALIMRRLPPIHGELGGKPVPRTFTALFLWLLWLLYVGLSALENYCVISSF